MTSPAFSSFPGSHGLLTRRRLIAAIGLASLALIAGAWYFQLVIGLVPCKLCLEQRLPHYAAIALAFGGFLVARSARWQGAVMLGLAGLMAWSCGLGIYHSGVEWAFFLGPSDCGGGVAQAAGVQDFMKQLQSVKVVSCAEAAWRLFGLSLAGWNAVASALLFGLALAGLLRREP